MRTSGSTNFSKKALGVRQNRVQLMLLLHYAITFVLDYAAVDVATMQ